jgi:phage shock protein E
MKPIFFLLAGALTFTSCNSDASVTENTTGQETRQQQTTKAGTVKTLSGNEAKDLLAKQPDVLILDVRTPEEYAAGHLKNARLLNKYDADFEAKIKALDRTKPYLVYCASGGRSGEATQQMNQLGFQQIYDARGFDALKKAGIPAEK